MTWSLSSNEWLIAVCLAVTPTSANDVVMHDTSSSYATSPVTELCSIIPRNPVACSFVINNSTKRQVDKATNRCIFSIPETISDELSSVLSRIKEFSFNFKKFEKSFRSLKRVKIAEMRNSSDFHSHSKFSANSYWTNTHCRRQCGRFLPRVHWMQGGLVRRKLSVRLSACLSVRLSV